MACETTQYCKQTQKIRVEKPEKNKMLNGAQVIRKLIWFLIFAVLWHQFSLYSRCCNVRPILFLSHLTFGIRISIPNSKSALPIENWILGMFKYVFYSYQFSTWAPSPYTSHPPLLWENSVNDRYICSLRGRFLSRKNFFTTLVFFVFYHCFTFSHSSYCIFFRSWS